MQDLCNVCSEIILIEGDKTTFGDFLVSARRNNPSNNPAQNYMTNSMVLANLQDKGGCPRCIDVFQRAVDS